MFNNGIVSDTQNHTIILSLPVMVDQLFSVPFNYRQSFSPFPYITFFLISFVVSNLELANISISFSDACRSDRIIAERVAAGAWMSTVVELICEWN